MELINQFKKTLLENGALASKVTVKNYYADAKRFAAWYEGTYQRSFPPPALPLEVVDRYLAPLRQVSPRSAKRYQSSLRKFFSFLTSSGVITYNPLINATDVKQNADIWHIREFDNFLYNAKVSPITIKNYLNDVNQFLRWINEVTTGPVSQISTQEASFAKIESLLIEEYKNRLLNEAGLSPLSVNRKLSSLRRYINWAVSKGFIKHEVEVAHLNLQADFPEDESPAENDLSALNDLKDLEANSQSRSLDTFDTLDTPDTFRPSYSRFAPLRLFQKSKKAINFIFDSLVVLSVIKSIEAIKYNLWKATGKQVFAPIPQVIKNLQEYQPLTSKQPLSRLDKLIKMGSGQAVFETGRVKSIPKSVYAPMKISTRALPFLEKIIYHLRYTRPNWYKKYHSYSFVHYVHFGIVLIVAVILGLRIYQPFIPVNSQASVLTSKIGPNRLISFQGRLNDSQDTPIIKESAIRFAIYSSQTAARPLWQEKQIVKPDDQGYFSVTLGKINPLEQAIFNDNPNLYLGISVGSDPELMPRQELANAGLAKSAEELQGLKPITGNNAGTENVILALDSSGNLTIGGNSNPTFQATGGEFRLSGQQLTLATNEGSNGNIVLNPDGTGIIDIQRPLQNTSEGNNPDLGASAVRIDDSLSILATSSAESALVINQNGTGDLISATTGGTARFTLSNTGTVTVGEDLKVLGNNLSTVTGTFSLANTNTLNLNIGGAATSVSIGATTGTTTINNNLKVGGLITMPSLTVGSIPYINSNNQLAQDNANFFWDQGNKRLGLGTAVPLYRLDVQDSQAAGSVAQVFNSSTDANADGLQIRLGITTAPQTTNRWINFLDGNGAVLGKIRGNNTSNTITFDSNGGDFAEYFKKANPSEQFEEGDAVCYAASVGVEKCNPESTGIVGIYSTDAGFVGAGNHGDDPNYVLVGLIGQLSVKISEATKQIKPGDPIAISLESGMGLKAEKAGQIVGRALESYDPTSSKSERIKISLNVSWYDPAALLMNDGSLATAFETYPSGSETLDTRDTPDTLDTFGSNAFDPMSSIQEFVSTLKDGLLEVKKISVQSLYIASEDITIGAKTLREYISSIVNEIIDKRFTEEKQKTIIVVSPLAEVSASTPTPSAAPQLTITPSPTASPSSALQNITNIYNTASESATPTPSPSAEPTPEASPSAEPTPNAVSSIKYQVSSENGQTASAAAIHDTKYLIHNTAPANIATFSAELSYVPNLKADFGQFNQGLIALGPTSLAETSISTQLSIGQNLTINDNSINTLGTDLSLQPLRQGNLAIMGGLVVIDTQGNLTVEGNATFAKDVEVRGTLAAGVISPISESDLVIKLRGKTQNSTQKDAEQRSSAFIVADATGSAKFSVNDLGDINASGNGKFMGISTNSFKIIRGAQADTSFTETVASGSAGTAVITANETERTIVTPYVSKDSLIYITPVSSTLGATPYIARQTEENPTAGSKGSFTIQIANPVTSDIKLNWWIIN